MSKRGEEYMGQKCRLNSDFWGSFFSVEYLLFFIVTASFLLCRTSKAIRVSLPTGIIYALNM